MSKMTRMDAIALQVIALADIAIVALVAMAVWSWA
jgi:hypothetical protein